MVVDIASVADSVPNVKEMSTRRSKARTSKGEVGLSASVRNRTLRSILRLVGVVRKGPKVSIQCS